MTPIPWRTSSYTHSNGDCVEIARTAEGAALIRDTKHRRGGHLTVGQHEWQAFLASTKHSQLHH